MTTPKRIRQVTPHPIGSGPALAYYFERMQLVQTIDAHVPRDKRRTDLSHGQATAALVAMTLNHSHALYAMEDWAAENKILTTIFPNLPASVYTDDRLGDTLDALYYAGLDTVQAAVTVALVQGFQVTVQAVHHDTTSFSFYGAYEGATEGPAITYGYSKDHRPDLKQIVYALSVNQDKLPLLGQALDGNYTDGPNYREHWRRLGELLPKSDFIYMGDSKMAVEETLREIIDGDGVFLSAQGFDKRTKKQVRKALQKAQWQFKPFRPLTDRVRPEDIEGYSYIPDAFSVGEGEEYRIRRLIIRSTELAKRHAAKRETHLKKVETGLQTLAGKLNRYKLKTEAQIRKAVDALFQRYPKAKDLIPWQLTHQEVRRRRFPNRGRPKDRRQARIEKRIVYGLTWKRPPRRIEKAARWDGIFLRITNATERRLPAACMLTEYKEQWKVEHTHQLMKGPIALAPVFLHTPRRIAAMALICLMAVQVLRLMEIQAVGELLRTQQTIVGLYPNRIATTHPPARRMIQALSTMEVIEIHEQQTRSVKVNYAVTAPTPLQKQILRLLGVPSRYYAQRRILERLKILKI